MAVPVWDWIGVCGVGICFASGCFQDFSSLAGWQWLPITCLFALGRLFLVETCAVSCLHPRRRRSLTADFVALSCARCTWIALLDNNSNTTFNTHDQYASRRSCSRRWCWWPVHL